jgi:tetratricopeptide (TPR) repeat protein
MTMLRRMTGLLCAIVWIGSAWSVRAQESGELTARAREQLEQELRSARPTPDAYSSILDRMEKAALLNVAAQYFLDRLAQIPEDSLAHFALGDTQRRLAATAGQPGLYEEAERHLSSALSALPGDRSVRLRLAEVRVSLGDHDGAVEALLPLIEPAAEDTPADLDALRLAVRARTAQRDFDGAAELLREIVIAKPSDVDSRLQFAEALRRQGRYDEAAAHLGAALRYRNRSPEVYYALGKVYAHSNDPDKAIEMYRRARRYDPDNVPARYELGDIFLENDNGRYAILAVRSALALDGRYSAVIGPLRDATTQEAADILARALADVPENAPLQSFVARLYRKLGNRDAARAHLEAAKRLNPDDPKTRAALAELLLEEAPQAASEELRAAASAPAAELDLSVLVPLAELYKREGDLEAYAETTEKVLAVAPGRPEQEAELGDALLRLADVARDRRDMDAWRARLRAAANAYSRASALAPENAQWKFRLATVYDELGQLKALRLYQEAAALAPDNAMVHYRWGVFLLNYRMGAEGIARMYDPADAIGHLQRALALDPDMGGAHYALGVALKRQGDAEAAVREFERADALGFMAAEGMLHLGQHYAESEQYGKAVEMLRRAAREMPDDVEVLKDFGFLALKHGVAPADKEAMAALAKAVELAPDDAEAQMNYGYALHSAGRSAEAVPHLERAAALDATSELVQYNLALALEGSGEAQRALAAWRRLLTLSEAGAYADVARERIRYLGGE